MAIKIDHYINGVWKDAQDRITHVSLCLNNEQTFNSGIKTSEADVIMLIKLGKCIYTLTWNYPGWNSGALVNVVNSNGREFLRTNANATETDNLDNSIDMEGFRI